MGDFLPQGLHFMGLNKTFLLDTIKKLFVLQNLSFPGKNSNLFFKIQRILRQKM